MNPIQLSGEGTIYEIVSIHQQIHDNWSVDTDMILDVSAITEVDASFIQLLASCKKTAESNHQTFQIINQPETLNDKMAAMFMQDFFTGESLQEEEA